MSTQLPRSVSGLEALFSTLKAPEDIPVNQRYTGTTIGPWWLRVLGWPLLNVGAMDGWKGKSFHSKGRVLNIVDKKGCTKEVMPIRASLESFSRGDGTVLLLSYPKTAPLPWNYIIDELRCLPDGRLLGLTTLKLPLLGIIPVPFILTLADGLL